MERSHKVRPGLVGQQRGGGSADYLLVAALVAVGAVTALNAMGESVDANVSERVQSEMTSLRAIGGDGRAGVQRPGELSGLSLGGEGQSPSQSPSHADLDVSPSAPVTYGRSGGGAISAQGKWGKNFADMLSSAGVWVSGARPEGSTSDAAGWVMGTAVTAGRGDVEAPDPQEATNELDGWAHTAASRHPHSNAALSDANRNGYLDVLEKGIFGWVFGTAPKILHQGEGSPWTAQGFTHDPSRDEILTSYYRQDDDNGGKDIPGIRLSIQDRDTGAEIEDVQLVGKDGRGGPLHGGGLAVYGDYVYVTGGDTVWVYRREDIEAAPLGGHVLPLYEYEDVAASSYATISDGRLFVGKYRNGEAGDLYSYGLGPNGELLGADGSIRAEAPPVRPTVSIFNELNNLSRGFSDVLAWEAAYGARHEGQTPSNIQGVEVVKGGYLFTQSHGADDPSDLWYQKRGDDEHRAKRLGDMTALSQGFTIIDGKIYAVSESGSYQFRNEYREAFGRAFPETIDIYNLKEFGIEQLALE